MEIHVVGIDLGKTLFHLVGLDSTGRVVVRKRLLAQTAAGLHSEHSHAAHRHGSLLVAHISWLARFNSRGMKCG